MNATIKQQQRQEEQQWSNLSSLSSSVAGLTLSGKDNIAFILVLGLLTKSEYFFVVVLSFFNHISFSFSLSAF